jgi:hypothetical protein
MILLKLSGAKGRITRKTLKIMWYNENIFISPQPREACAKSTLVGGLVKSFFFFFK